MIVRIWRGWTAPNDADAYQRLLNGEIVPGFLARSVEGLLGADVLRRDAGGEVEFTVVMSFADWAAVEEFAGDRTSSVVPAEARRLLARYEPEAVHHDLVAQHRPAGP
ncbi:antibiotic biosynthesis monooxygenase [Actinomadura napierensis]|uniref:Antibiotic biosynthesis monooxygenase n=1 Tax=Actinomadura napierensis TaxID=267854 RepID=A0ABP5LLA0_9ACTN